MIELHEAALGSRLVARASVVPLARRRCLLCSVTADCGRLAVLRAGAGRGSTLVMATPV